MGILQNLGQGILRRGLSRALTQKASAVGPLIARLVAGNAVWSQRNFEQLAKEGYQQNAVVNACVARIAQAVATIPVCAYQISGKGPKKRALRSLAVLWLSTERRCAFRPLWNAGAKWCVS